MKRWLRTGQLARAHRKRASGAGYTIIETMIVLAVTTAMFGAIAIFFSGKQAKTEFTQAVRDYEASIESIISEVVNGHYASFACNAIGNGPPTVFATPSADAASNEGCIFVGKTMQIDPLSPADKSTEVQTLVGRQTLSSLNTRDVESLIEAQPVNSPAAKSSFNHTFQLQVTRMALIGSNVTVEAIGFVRSFARSGSTGGGSADLVKLYALTGTSSLVNASGLVTIANFNPAPGGVLVCLKGINDQRAEITIGSGRNQTSLFSRLGTPASGVCS